MTDEVADPVKILPRIVARSAGVLHVGVLNSRPPHVGLIGAQTSVHQIVSASYRCDIRATGEMLFASPLSISQSNRVLAIGANVFDVAIQGYNTGDWKLAKRNFDYLFRMAPLRTEEHSAKLSADDAVSFRQVASAWVAAIQSLPDRDLADNAAEFLAYDTYLQNIVKVRVLLDSGEIINQTIEMTALYAAQWLANYVLDLQ